MWKSDFSDFLLYKMSNFVSKNKMNNMKMWKMKSEITADWNPSRLLVPRQSSQFSSPLLRPVVLLGLVIFFIFEKIIFPILNLIFFSQFQIVKKWFFSFFLKMKSNFPLVKWTIWKCEKWKVKFLKNFPYYWGNPETGEFVPSSYLAF